MAKDTQLVSTGSKIWVNIIFYCEPLDHLISNNTFLCPTLVVQKACWAVAPLIKACFFFMSGSPVLLRMESFTIVPVVGYLLHSFPGH